MCLERGGIIVYYDSDNGSISTINPYKKPNVCDSIVEWVNCLEELREALQATIDATERLSKLNINDYAKEFAEVDKLLNVMTKLP